MSTIEPIDNSIRPVERVRPAARRGRRDPEQQQPHDEPREREPEEREEPSGGGLVDVRV